MGEFMRYGHPVRAVSGCCAIVDMLLKPYRASYRIHGSRHAWRQSPIFDYLIGEAVKQAKKIQFLNNGEVNLILQAQPGPDLPGNGLEVRPGMRLNYVFTCH